MTAAATLLVGVGIPARTTDDPLAKALAAEAAGYDFVSTSDHPASNLESTTPQPTRRKRRG